MEGWSFSEVAAKLECSPQNIYQKKGKLSSIGGLVVDEIGKEKINETGFNYLQELRKSTLKSVSTSENKSNSTIVENNVADTQNTVFVELKQKEQRIVDLEEKIEDLKSRLREETDQKKYWQELYVKQNDNLHKDIFPLLLDTKEGNIQNEEKRKKGFFGKIFS